MKKDKKGQMNGLALAVMALVVATFVLVLGIQLLAGFQTATDDYQATVVNETGWMNNTGYRLAKYNTVGFNNPVIVEIRNGSNMLVTVANYSLNQSTYYLYNSTIINYSAVNITYTYYYGQEAYSATNKSIVGNASFADYWQIIVLAVVIGVVIALIIGVMSSRKIK